MNIAAKFAIKHPISSFVFLTYSITWVVWFSIPLFSNSDWTLVKILAGVGMGPSLAALIMNRLQDKKSVAFSYRWLIYFTPVFTCIILINFSSLISGNAPDLASYANVSPSSFSLAGVTGTLVSAFLCAYIFASSATSRTLNLRKIIRWRVGLRWWSFVLVFPVILAFAAIVFSWLQGNELTFFQKADLTIGNYFLYVMRTLLFTFLVVAVGEEVGWRGWMLPKLQEKFSPLSSSIILGLVWGLWHLPLFFNGFYSQGPESIIGYLILGPIYAVIYTWLYIKTDGNLLLIIVLHTMMNSIDLILAKPPSEIVVLLIVIVVVTTGKMWRNQN